MTQAENSRNTEQPAGGPAFPCHPDVIPRNDRDYAGMTLRDYFAAKAMQGIVSSIDGEDNYRRLRGHATDAGLSVSEWIARDSYKQADAMLKARNHSVGQSENDRRVAACLDARKQRDKLRDALKSCIEYGAMTGDDWVTDKARAALAATGEPQ